MIDPTTTTPVPLTDAEFHAVAGHSRPTRVDVDTMREAMSAPSGTRPSALAYWHDQIVSVRSTEHVDRFADDARAWWLSGTTLADLTRRA